MTFSPVEMLFTCSMKKTILHFVKTESSNKLHLISPITLGEVAWKKIKLPLPAKPFQQEKSQCKQK